MGRYLLVELLVRVRVHLAELDGDSIVWVVRYAEAESHKYWGRLGLEEREACILCLQSSFPFGE